MKQFYGRMEKLDAMFQELERAQKEYEQAAAVHGRVQEDLGTMCIRDRDGCGLGAPGACASGPPDVSGAELEFDGTRFLDPATGESVTLTDLGTASMCGSQEALQVTETHSSPVSPPPFMAGALRCV